MTSDFSFQIMLPPRLQLCQRFQEQEKKGNKAKKTCAGKLVQSLASDFFYG